MKIAIIGAGAAGLAALRQSLEEGHECVVFEQTDKIGGTWNYTDETDFDENGLPIHSSMYQGLRTNLPKELMEYEDFPYEHKGHSFIKQPDVLEYIQRFASNFNLFPHIKFLSHIIEVSPSGDTKWSIKEKNMKTNQVTTHSFDAVIICVGHYSVPKIPYIPGSEIFQKRSIHSHRFRKPDAYKGKKVLIIGAGGSGVDIARIVIKVAEKVYLSYGETVFETPEFNDFLIRKPLVKSFKGNKALFEDNTEEEIDDVIYCTGYLYSYPFLAPACKINVENDFVQYLYKHVVNVEYPTMGFIGIPFQVCLFPLFDVQARFFLRVLEDPAKISKEEMMSDILNDLNQKKEPLHHAHKIGPSLHEIYFDSLANLVQIKKSKPVIHKLFNHIAKDQNPSKNYKIVSDEEFIVLE